MAVMAVSHAKSYCDDVEFSTEDAARTDLDYMCDVVEAAINAGATTINIPDTVGYAETAEYGLRIKHVFDKLGDLIKKNKVIISVHCHNDFGLAVANSLEAVRNGATQVECTVNGIGERAGNCSMEEVVMNIKTRKDYFKDITTGINTKEIYRASRMVSDLTGLRVQRNKAIIGENAFAHEAGIHQHGVLSDKATYEIMKPEEIGWEGTNIVIGKHSGKHAVEKILKDTGFELVQDQINDILKKIKDLADKQKEVMREDIIAIASDISGELAEEEQIVKLEDFRINTGNNITPEAEVTLIVDGKKKKGKAKGDGPVDAASKAITNIVGLGIKLKEYDLKAITGGTDALAHVGITVQDNKGRSFKSEGVNEDIIMASVIALIKCINQVMKVRK